MLSNGKDRVKETKTKGSLSLVTQEPEPSTVLKQGANKHPLHLRHINSETRQQTKEHIKNKARQHQRGLDIKRRSRILK